MKKKNFNFRLSIITILFCLLAFSAISAAETNIYVKFGDVEGESTDSDHANWSDVHSYSEALSLPVSSTTGGGTQNLGMVAFSPITIHKFIDKASAHLRQYLSNGQAFPTVEIEFVKAGGLNLKYLRIVLDHALLTSADMSVDTSVELPVEKIGITFERITWIYTVFDTNGNPQGISEFGWDLNENRPI